MSNSVKEIFFDDYKHSNDFKNVMLYNKDGFETVYLSKSQMIMSVY